MDGKADLHLHTTFSDGVLSPRELIEYTARAGLTTISITDHDNTGAFEEARAYGERAGVEVIPGVELSTMIGNQEIHILGYFLDHQEKRFQDLLATCRSERRKRAERIVEKLNEMNVPLSIEAVLDQAGPGSVGRPHIANALVNEGLTDTYQEAFLKYLGFGKPAYEKKYLITPSEAIQMIAVAGGLSFLAHPGNSIDERTVLDMIDAGIDGIEVFHPSHTPSLTAHYAGIVEEYFLLASGGSDFHGGRRNDDNVVGKYGVSAETVEMMRHRLG
jgi:predicted metal-dependent phosphoesterase TrpH